MDISSISARPTTSAAIPNKQLTTEQSASHYQFADQFAAQPIDSPNSSAANSQPASPQLAARTQTPPASEELRQAFHDFVGQTFFAEMIKACRSGQQPSAYFNGGRAEEIFQGQLDQVLSEELSKSSADKIADPMFDLFMLKRQS